MGLLVFRLLRTFGLVLCGLLLSQSTFGQLSFSTDFDGRGTGTSITVGTFHHSAGPTASSSSRESIQIFLNNQYQNQMREAARQAEEERLRQEAEAAKRRQDVRTAETILSQLEQLENSEGSVAQRSEYTREVLDLTRQFDEARRSYLDVLPSYEQRLASSLSHINVPPPSHPRHFHRILVWGLWKTPEEAARAASNGTRDPFTGLPFDDVFAFGSSGWPDLERVGLDHLLGQVNRLSGESLAHIGELKGAEADEIVCHSNGCRIVEVLIATGVLRAHVVRMLGPDNASLELDRLRTLKESRGLTELSVYMVKGDPVPLIDPGWRIMDLMARIGAPLQTYMATRARDATYQLLGITSRPGYSLGAEVQVRVLSAPPMPGAGAFDKHQYALYDRLVTGWRSIGCLEAGGETSQRCMIY